MKLQHYKRYVTERFVLKLTTKGEIDEIDEINECKLWYGKRYDCPRPN